MWDGYGWLHGSPAVGFVRSSSGELDPIGNSFMAIPPALPPEFLHGPRVALSAREYVLFEGPLSAATTLGSKAPNGAFFAQSPNLFWPQDQTWCVASEIDIFCTLVAGSETLAEALLAHPALEAWRVDPEDPISYDSDQNQHVEQARYTAPAKLDRATNRRRSSRQSKICCLQRSVSPQRPPQATHGSPISARRIANHYSWRQIHPAPLGG